MMSLTSEYALRAIVYIARNEDQWPLSGNEVASAAGVPSKYLAKILGDLVRHGVLDARRGRGGGFSLARGAADTRLWEVLEPFERFNRAQCPFSDQRCSSDTPCLAHPRWEKVQGAYHGFLKGTTVRTVAFSRGAKNGRGSKVAKKTSKKTRAIRTARRA